MSTTTESNRAKVVGAALLGVLLMFAGMYVSTRMDFGFEHTLAEMGVPLDIGKTIAVIGVLLILFPVIRIFFITPLAEAIQARTTELENTFGEAERLRSEMTQMRTDYERRIADTEAQARETIQAQIREAQNLRQTLMSEAAQKADQLVAQAQQQIEQEKNRVLTELRLEVVNLALAATEKLVGENMDTAKNRRLVDEFIDTVEVPR
jgi:F-type H+-transporting ATPase subunit b